MSVPPLALVIDASVAAKWYLPEEHSAEAERLLDEGFLRHAPEALFAEVANVLWKRCHQRGEITAEQVGAIRACLEAVPLEVYPTRDLLDDAVAIALETGRTVYDAIYVALADRLGCRLVTADRRLYNALAAGPWSATVHWVADPHGVSGMPG
jgi:predicted nucleic acid-binding protein